MRRGAPRHRRRVSVTPRAPLPLPDAPPAKHPPPVTLLMNVWGFLERELVGNANASQAGAGTGAKLKPQHPKSCWKCWAGGGGGQFFSPSISQRHEQGIS